MSKLVKTFSLLFLITVLLKSLDIVKSLIIASKLGISDSADVYLSVIMIPDSLVILVGFDTLRGVINSEYSSLNSKNEQILVWKSFSNLYSIVLFTTVIIVSIIFILRAEIVNFLLPGFSGLKYSKALEVAAIVFPIFFFKSLLALFSSIFNAFKKFYYPLVASAVVSVFIIVSIFLPYYKNDLIYNLSWSNLAGNLFYILILVYGIYRLGGNIKLSMPKLDPVTKSVIINCATTLILMFCNQLYLMSRNFFASYLGEGAISTLNYAGTVNSVISIIVFATIFSALLSNLSSLVTSDKRQKVKDLFLKTYLILIYLSVPIIVFFVIYSTEILTLLYKRGNFTLYDIQKTQVAFVWEILSVISFISIIIPTALYLAKKKYVMLTMIGSVTYIAGIFSNFVFSKIFGYYGISISGFIVTGFYGILLFYFARKFLGKYNYYLKKIFILFFCGGGSIIILSGFKWTVELFVNISGFVNILLFTFAGFVFLSIVYLILSSILNVNYFKLIKFKEIISIRENIPSKSI